MFAPRVFTVEFLTEPPTTSVALTTGVPVKGTLNGSFDIWALRMVTLPVPAPALPLVSIDSVSIAVEVVAPANICTSPLESLFPFVFIVVLPNAMNPESFAVPLLAIRVTLPAFDGVVPPFVCRVVKPLDRLPPVKDGPVTTILLGDESGAVFTPAAKIIEPESPELGFVVMMGAESSCVML